MTTEVVYDVTNFFSAYLSERYSVYATSIHRIGKSSVD